MATKDTPAKVRPILTVSTVETFPESTRGRSGSQWDAIIESCKNGGMLRIEGPNPQSARTAVVSRAKKQFGIKLVTAVQGNALFVKAKK